MSKLTRSILSALLVVSLPIAAVKAVKRSSLGPILDTPKSRQRGDLKSPVVIVEYSDFQCPSCAAMQPTLHQLLETYQGKIRLAYKYYPLTRLHKNTMNASHAAECAAEQGQFWIYSDRLFATQPQWADLADPTPIFTAFAQQARLDMTSFEACIKDPGKLAVIEKDMAEGRSRDIRATPTFFIGDERLVANYLSSDGARVIEKELRNRR